MPRARTGTLVPPGADGLWRARVTKTHADGSTTRPLYLLGTTDRALARRKLARLVALVESGADLLDAAEGVSAAERVKDYAEAWLTKREAQGVVMAPDERRNIERHVLPEIGRLPLCDVRPSHVRGILESVAAKTYRTGKVRTRERRYRHETVVKVRGALHRMFRAAQEDDLVEHNPVAPVHTPKAREVRKERAILTDAEFTAFVSCAAVDLELRMLALVARCEGGMRTGDLHRWDWTQIDRLHFAECIVPRAKKGVPQALAIPGVLAPFVRAWWESAGKPESGPVFPVRIGKRVGQSKRPENSYAKRLRRELFRARVHRMPPVEVPATKPGARTDLGKPAVGTKLAPNPRDPLYFETATTLPVDFHSFRRAFNTALAGAGVNVQHAMHLAGHSDAKTHMRYVMQSAAMRTIPDTALPRLPVGPLAKRHEAPAAAPDPAGIVTSLDDSTRVLDVVAERVNDSGTPGRTRTCDPRLRRPLLYPTELRARTAVLASPLRAVSANEHAAALAPHRTHPLPSAP
jgi:integrase